MSSDEALTGEKHQDGSAGNVSRSAAPATDDARPEGHKVKEKGNDEKSNHGAAHIWKNKNKNQTFG